MKEIIQYIENELESLYQKTEVKAFVRLILEHVCGLNYTQQILLKDEHLKDAQKHEIRNIVKRLKTYEPVQYILGETEFAGMRLLVNPAVLIPRPETEELVQWIDETGISSKSDVLDVGSGTGCIALAISKLIPDISVHAVDISEDALDVARNNAELNGLDVNFLQADILNWEQYDWKKYGAIVSNPPYVRVSEKERMKANVLQYEPGNALFVPDSDPLIFYRCISELAEHSLEHNGWLFFEINESLGDEMKELVEQYGFNMVEVRKDLSGKDRMLRCRKK